MLSSNRVIWNDGGTLKDLSTILNNYLSESKVVDYASGDYIYVGSDVPFNHRYIRLAEVNDQAADVTVEIWDGNSWEPAVDVIDYTEVGGVPLAQSGILQWTTDKNKSWARETSTEDMTGSGLTGIKIYNMYWARISYSATLDSATELKYVGHKFSKDEDLASYYPDLNRSNVKTAFAAGKVDWDDQHIAAAEELFNDLRKQRELWAKGQIFQWEPFTVACAHKVAQIVYNSFGEEYEGRRDKAGDDYGAALEGSLSQGIDKDEDGHVDEEEQVGMCIGIVRR
jgi:hypothetical protein